MKHSIRAILVGLALGTASASAVEAATIYVANNGVDSRTCGHAAKTPCRSISRGIAVAADGDTLEVGPGIYGDVDADGQFVSPGDEQGEIGAGCECLVHITKALRLISRSGATQTFLHPGRPNAGGVYAGSGLTALIQVDAPGTIFGEKDHGFTVASASVAPGTDGLIGIRIADTAAGSAIGGNFILMNERGVFSSAPAVIIADNLIQTNTVGVMMEGGQDAFLTGNAVQRNDVGLGLLGNDMTITGNLVTGNRSLGVTLHGGTGHTLSGNSILGNGVGVLLQTTTEAAVHGNNIFGNDSDQASSPHAGLISNSSFALDVSGNYWGAPATADAVYALGAGSVQSSPTAKARFAVAIQPMK